MFSDEMTAAAEIMIKKGKRILQLASQIKCARAQSIKRAQERKEAVERQCLLDTQHYHFYEVTPIPLTIKTEKIDEEMTIEPRNSFDPYPYFDKKQVEAFYVKEEAFHCSSASEDIKENERKRKHKKGKKTKKDLPILPTQPVPPVEKVAMPMGKTGAPGKKKKIIEGPHMCHVCGVNYMNIINFNSHIASHRVTYKCPKCDQIFRSENALKNHRRAENSSKMHNYQQCGKNFQLQSSLLNHIETHSSTVYGYNVVPTCKFITKCYSCFREHNKYGHNTSKDFQCTICHKAFQTPSEMCSHPTKQHGPVHETP